MLKKFLRGPGIYIIIILFVVLLSVLLSNSSKDKEIKYSDFLNKIKASEVSQIYLNDENRIVGAYTTNSVVASDKDFPKKYDFEVYISDVHVWANDYAALKAEMGKEPIPIIENAPPTSTPWYLSVLPYVLLGVMVIFFYFFMMNQTQGGNKAMNFGRTNAKIHLADKSNKNRKTFGDVAGANEEKEELVQIVDFLKNPQKYLDLGARIPKGVLLVGHPGTGKTLLAKAVAGEAEVPFFTVSGSEFVEMFVGVGASRVRDLFAQAKKSSPCIVFIDEIDAVGRKRGAGMGGGHDEREQTLNQLLVEMDGFSINEGIIVMAATNRVDVLDPALLRPGRFDRQIFVHLPDPKGREDIFAVHAKNKPLDPEVNANVISRLTTGFTGADMENMLNEAALSAARQNKKSISMADIEEAITKVLVGPEKRSRVITEKDKRITAFHESGHAVVARALPNYDPVQEISIVPRGHAAGYTLTLPKEELDHMTRSKMLDTIAMMLAGRVAEEIFIKDISTGALNDLQRASDIARRMITEYGMCEDIGPVYLGGDQEVFIGRDFTAQKAYSDELAAKIDLNMKGILEGAYQRAKEILTEKSDLMLELVNQLLEKEKLSREEFEQLYTTYYPAPVQE